MQLVDVSTSTSAIERPMQPNRMGVDAIKDNPDMFQYYTGFPTYKVFLAFYSYLGPAVDSLIYSEKSVEKPRTTFSPTVACIMISLSSIVTLSECLTASRSSTV